MKKLGFTLAETLIVMGIIGVVAALTVPNLNSSTGDREKVAKVKKVYSNLNDAYGRATAVYGPIEDWKKGGSYVTATTFAERLTEFMKVSKNCGSTSNQGCFSQKKVMYANNTDSTDILDTYNPGSAYRFTTADGTSILITQPPVECLGIWIDIDGPQKGKNQYGSDIFEFAIYYGNLNTNSATAEIQPYGYNSSFSTILNNVKTTGEYGAKWILDYDNVDYLKCPSKLTANNTSCK